MSINTDQIIIRNAQIVTFISFLLFTFGKKASVMHFGWKETWRGQVALSWVNPDETELEVVTLSLDLLCLLLTSNPTSQSENMQPLQLLRDIDEQTKARFEVGRLQPRCIQSRPSGREKCLPAILLVYEFISLTAAHSRTWHKMQKLQYDGVKVQTES